MNDQKYYIPEVLIPWQSVKIGYSEEPIQTSEVMGDAGLIPVFTSKELCKKHYPDHDVIPLNSNP